MHFPDYKLTPSHQSSPKKRKKTKRMEPKSERKNEKEKGILVPILLLKVFSGELRRRERKSMKEFNRQASAAVNLSFSFRTPLPGRTERRDQWTTKLMDAAVVQVSKPVLNSRH